MNAIQATYADYIANAVDETRNRLITTYNEGRSACLLQQDLCENTAPIFSAGYRDEANDIPWFMSDSSPFTPHTQGNAAAHSGWISEVAYPCPWPEGSPERTEWLQGYRAAIKPKEAVTEYINTHIPHGCCGGCL